MDVHEVEAFKKDPKVKDQLKRGETNGCFYIESPAMRGLLKKLAATITSAWWRPVPSSAPAWPNPA